MPVSGTLVVKSASLVNTFCYTGEIPLRGACRVIRPLVITFCKVSMSLRFQTRRRRVTFKKVYTNISFSFRLSALMPVSSFIVKR